jgi:hypothetical protein
MQPVRAAGVLELSQGRRICIRVSVRCSRRDLHHRFRSMANGLPVAGRTGCGGDDTGPLSPDRCRGLRDRHDCCCTGRSGLGTACVRRSLVLVVRHRIGPAAPSLYGFCTACCAPSDTGNTTRAPAVGAVAYLTVGGGAPDIVAYALIGYALLQGLLLLRTLSCVREEPFAPSY